jgi:hypothetical protein
MFRMEVNHAMIGIWIDHAQGVFVGQQQCRICPQGLTGLLGLKGVAFDTRARGRSDVPFGVDGLAFR